MPLLTGAGVLPLALAPLLLGQQDNNDHDTDRQENPWSEARRGLAPDEPWAKAGEINMGFPTVSGEASRDDASGSGAEE